MKPLTMTIIIFVFANVMWISTALGRYKRKNWDNNFEKFADYLIIFIGVPFTIFIIVKVIMSLV